MLLLLSVREWDYEKESDFVSGVFNKFIANVNEAIRRFKRSAGNLGALGKIGMVISELYKVFTWHVMTITGKISIQNSIRLAFPEFYFGFMISVAMIAAYFIINKKVYDI